MPQCPPDLLQRKENSRCADCRAPNPEWASVKIGVFLCTACGGIHRKLGTHISFVRSVKLDEWKQEQIDLVRAVSNARANAYYEHNVPAGERFEGQVALAGSDKIDNDQAKKLEVWIRNKYEHKKYAIKGQDDPYVRFKRGENLDDLDGGGGGGGSSPRDDRHKHKHKEKHKHKHKDKEHFQEEPPPQMMAPPMSMPMAPPPYGTSPYPMGPPGPQLGPPMAPPGPPGPLPQFGGAPPWDGGGGPGPPYGGPDPMGMWPGPGGPDYYNGGCGVGGAFGGPAMPGPNPAAFATAPAAYAMGPQAGFGAERRAALACISRLFAAPQTLGVAPSCQVLRPFGFDLQAAEFDPVALKKPRYLRTGGGPGGGSPSLFFGGGGTPPTPGAAPWGAPPTSGGFFGSTPGNPGFGFGGGPF